ncbi:MAG: cell envelope integrity protein CreD [Ignavibacteria bacterium]|nr:cell envelope integrity protein CreD [Ignavibacteria bacterium]
MEKQSSFKSINEWAKNSIILKLLIMGFLILVLLIPSKMTDSLIKERESTYDSATVEVGSKWGKMQTIAGPILSVPYNDTILEKIKYAHFLPEELIINGEIIPERRNRGIYKVVVYNSKLKFDGVFTPPKFSGLNLNETDFIWEDAFLSIGITDLRGIQEKIELDWNDKKLLFSPGMESKDIIKSGVSVNVPLDTTALKKSNYKFSFGLNINGSSELNFIPLGKETDVKLNSTWNNPGFDGAFLPDNREINADGFQADWKILHLNRTYPQQWKGSFYNIHDSIFGVRLLFPVNEYQKIMRSSKYAILFIFLTFLIFFFVEVINKKRIHPLKYLLVGLGLIIFYTLLLSLTEHLDFKFAYLISSVSIILLITFYSKSFLSRFLTILIGIILTILYLFLYSLLQLQDYALLLGSIGLFVVLAIVMYFSRKIDYGNSFGSDKIKEDKNSVGPSP